MMDDLKVHLSQVYIGSLLYDNHIVYNIGD